MRYDLKQARRMWDEDLVRRPPSMWRYRELLPLRDISHRVTMGEGGTPLFRAEIIR